MRRVLLIATTALLAGGCVPQSGAENATPTPVASPTPNGAPAAVVARSLLWTDPALLDDPAVAGLGRVLPNFGGSGPLVDAWFHAFGTTSHSQRYGPGLLIDAFAGAHGADATQWDLNALPFKATGIHVRLDRMSQPEGGDPGHCGELRISYASTDPTYQPFFLIFLFRMPVRTGDIAGDGSVTCQATASRFAALAPLGSTDFLTQAKSILDETWIPANAIIAESLEQTISPWEWRQWNLAAATPDNLPLYETIDIDRINAAGTDRTNFLAWVTANSAALDTRTLAIDPSFRSQSIRRAEGSIPVPIDLTSVDQSAVPALRQHLEIVGCPTCHTADADFVQMRADRTTSPFFTKELDARRAFMDAVNHADRPVAPYGPLQANPVLPP